MKTIYSQKGRFPKSAEAIRLSYTAVQLEIPVFSDFLPRHSLIVPPSHFCRAELDELTFEETNLFNTRGEAFSLAAIWNRKELPSIREHGGQDQFYWWVVVEIGNPEKWWCNFSLEGHRGVIDMHEIPIRIIKPTADELRKFVPEKKWTPLTS